MRARSLPPSVLLAGAALVVATPVVTWWALGDLSAVDDPEPDYMVRPLPLSDGAELAIGIAAALMAGAALVVLARAMVRREASPRWGTVLAELVAAGFFCGLGWRAVTAPVIGANFGGGMLLVVLPPVVLGLVTAAVHEWDSLRRDR